MNDTEHIIFSGPCFNVDSDVLARSPSGSVADLTQIQSDNEMDKSTDGIIEESNEIVNDAVFKQESIEINKEPLEKDSTAENETEKEEADLDKLDAKVAVTVTSPQGTEYPQGSPAPDPEASKETNAKTSEEFVNSQGVTFTPTADMVDDSGSLIPYGLPCVRELFRFLVSLINPHDGIGKSNF